MQKKSKRIVLIVISVLFVLSVGYFALLAPTTAWFFQREDRPYTFSFADFDTSVSSEIEDLEVQLRATTRFADAGEKLFDEVVHVVKVETTNNSSKNAQIRAVVEQTDDTPSPGLHWFLMKAPEADGETEISYKKAVEDMLAESISLLDYEYIYETSGKTVEQLYEEYNQEALSILDKHNKTPMMLEAGKSTDVYLVFWVEYGETVADLDKDELVTLSDYHVNVTFTAEPYSHPTSTMAISTSVNLTRVRVLVPANENVSVCDTPYTGSYYYSGSDDAQEISSDGIIPQFSGTVELRDLPTGMRFKLQVLNNGAVFSDTETAYTSGTVNSAGNTITIQAAN